MTDQNYGDKADEILHHLTLIEERLHDVENGHRMSDRQKQDFREAVEAAQSRANEILEDYEQEHGPIDPVHKA